jgi:hypothetical protein
MNLKSAILLIIVAEVVMFVFFLIHQGLNPGPLTIATSLIVGLNVLYLFHVLGSGNASRTFEFGRTHVVRPKGKHQATIVWLHGIGDNGSRCVANLNVLFYAVNGLKMDAFFC